MPLSPRNQRVIQLRTGCAFAMRSLDWIGDEHNNDIAKSAAPPVRANRASDSGIFTVLGRPAQLSVTIRRHSSTRHPKCRFTDWRDVTHHPRVFDVTHYPWGMPRLGLPGLGLLDDEGHETPLGKPDLSGSAARCFGTPKWRTCASIGAATGLDTHLRQVLFQPSSLNRS